MNHTDIKVLLTHDFIGKNVTVKAWVKFFRNSSFLIVNDGSCIQNLQAVLDIEKFPESSTKNIHTGCSVELFGLIQKSLGKGQDIELVVDKLVVLGEANPDEYPLQAKKHSLEFLREIAHLRFRTNTFGAVFRVRNTLSFAIHQFFNEKGFLKVKANSADATDLLIEAAEKLNVNYYIYNKPENEKTSLLANNITFDDLLEHVFKGKKYTFRNKDGFYLIGEQITEGLRSTELIQLENRSIESVLTSLPKVFSEKVEIKEFVELNSLIVSGSKNSIEELKLYIKQIDKVVPLVQIEVIIVQYNKSYDIQSGLKAGLDKINQVQTSGVLFPTTDMNLNNTSVNSLIDAFNGLGFIKLGKVTDAFYLNLKLLESNSAIKIESTPKIATLSGHEATLAIGETSYYFEQNNRILNNNIGNGGDILQSGTWKSTDANLSVSIKPYVSTDENVTLTINVEKSAFLGRAGENAPPGKATQKFQSLIRVKNGEMILLGGLDELKKENSGSGVPLVSRIPVVKWFFSSRKKAKGDSKLHIFIKPTIVY